MARVPTVAERGQAVGSVAVDRAPQAFLEANAPVEAFGGGGLFGQMASAGDALNNFAAAIQKGAEDDDDILLTENMNSVSTAVTDWVHNPVNGALATQGKTAIGVTSKVMADFDAYAATLPQPSTTSGQAAQRERLFREKAALAKMLSTHERTQIDAHATQVSNVAIGDATQSAARAWNDPSALAAAENVITSQSEQVARRKGMGADATKELVEKNISQAHLATITGALAAEDHVTAQRILDDGIKNNKLQPEDRDKALAAVREGSVLGDAQSIVDRLEADSSMSDEERWSKVKTMTDDPKTRAEAEKQIRSNATARQAFEDRRVNEQFSSVSEKARSGQPLTAVDLEDMTPRMRASLDRDVEYGKRKLADPDFERQTDPAVLKEWEKTVIRPDVLADMTRNDLSARFESGVSKTVWENDVVPTWQRAKLDANKAANANAEEIRKATSATGRESQLEAIFALAGVDADGDANTLARSAFRLAFNEASAARGLTTDTEKDALLREMAASIIQYNRPGGGDLNTFGGPTEEAVAGLMSDKQWRTLAKDAELPRNERDGFVARAPILASALRGARLPRNRDTIMILDTAVRAVPAADRIALTAGMPAILAVLKRDGKVLSRDNIVQLYNNAKKAGGSP